MKKINVTGLGRNQINRRHVLKGIGVTMALPWLEAMAIANPFSSSPIFINSPKRIAFTYIPNGVIGRNWFPKQVGKMFDLPQSLQPLEELRDNIVVISGLDRDYVSGADPHSQCGSCWLTSSPPNEQLDGVTPVNTTLDQILARKFGAQTAFPSIELSCNSFTDNLEPKIFDAISWYGPGHDAKSENNPIELFRRLFGNAAHIKSSVLDSILVEAQDLKLFVGQNDRRKLDEYLESVRAIEKRIQRQNRDKDRLKDLSINQPDSVPKDRGEYIRLMADLMVLAFQTDMTRIATFMVGPERWQTPQMYHGVFDQPVNHHEMTHNHTYDDDVAKIDQFHVKQFAYMIEKMKSMPEGDGTLLDNSLMVMGSGLGDGSAHSYKQLPTIIAGGANGCLPTGRHIRCDQGTPLANLWLSIANQTGLDLERFADSDGMLNNLFES